MFVSTTQVEVRYAETDQMGVVYHANFLVWLELGRTKIIKDLGFNYIEMEQKGFLAPVVNVNINYKKSVRYGDTVSIKTWIEEHNGIKTVYGYEVLNEQGEICAAATTTHVVIKKETFKTVSVKKFFPEWHEKYEQIKKNTSI